jgi:hypothetical protein
MILNINMSNATDKKTLECINIIISNAKAYILGTYHGLAPIYITSTFIYIR